MTTQSKAKAKLDAPTVVTPGANQALPGLPARADVSPPSAKETAVAAQTPVASLAQIAVPRQGGENCTSAWPIPALPFADFGTTVGYVNDYDPGVVTGCPYSGGTAPDVVYSFAPAADVCVDISLCTNSAYDTKVYVLASDCATVLFCNDDSCSTPSYPSAYVSKIVDANLAGGSTYYIVVDGYGTSSGDYTIDVTECAGPCILTCPSGSIDEGEPCGTDTNGGCNSTPAIFGAIACGETICGTAFADGTTRDTDWYRLEITGTTVVTLTGMAEFPLQLLLVNYPAGECVGDPVYSAVTAEPCVLATLVSECLAPGTYYVWAGPSAFEGAVCGDNDIYWVSVACAPCQTPTGACCLGTVCEATNELYQCQTLGGTWYEGQDCATFQCPAGCLHRVELWDSYGDGWNGNTLDVYVDSVLMLDEITLPSGAGPLSFSFLAATGATIQTVYNPIGSYTNEPYYKLFDGVGVMIAQDGGSYVQPTGLTVTGNCEVVLAACCINGQCSMLSQPDCAAANGVFFAGQDCQTFTCPGGCQHRVELLDSYGDGWNGNTLDVSVNGNPVLSGITLASGYGPAVFTFLAADGDVITTTYTGSSWPYENCYTIYDGIGLVLATDGVCGTTAPVGITTYGRCTAPETGACCFYDGTCQVTLPGDCPAGLAEFLGLGMPCSACPCFVLCPPGSVDEGEPCGTDTNGGCNSTPAIFGAIACGETICGTAFADGSTRDTDWYIVNFTGSAILTITARAEFPLQLLLIDDAGNDCADYTYTVATGAACTDVTLTSLCVSSASTYYVWVGPSTFTGVTCGANDTYWVNVACEPCEATGACCLGEVCEATLTQTECDLLGGTLYANQTCPEFICPCTIVCPPGGVDEEEPCGTDTNGGCNSTPPVFGAIACGETICGTAYADGSTRDTDWFRVNYSGASVFTITARAAFPLQLLLIEDPGNDCLNYTYTVLTGAACQQISLTTACLAPGGVYYVWVGPSDFSGVTCGANDAYWVHLECAPCSFPGACCIGNTCVEGLLETECLAQNGRFLGEGSNCGAGSYEAVACTNAFEDISGTGTPLTLGDDQGIVVPIGFNFSFFGSVKTEIGVCSNGYLTFGGVLTAYLEAPIPTAATPNDLIAVLWDDYNPSTGGTVHYQTLGTAPNRRFIAQYTNIPQYSGTDANTFQAVLFEGTNCIELRYGTCTLPAADYRAGVENADGTVGLDVTTMVAVGGCIEICYVPGENPCICGDLDSDGDVDVDDYWVFVDAYGTCFGDIKYNAAADLNGDFCINLLDYQAWLACYYEANGRQFVAPGNKKKLKSDVTIYSPIGGERPVVR